MSAPKTRKRSLERQAELDRKGLSPAQVRNYAIARERWKLYGLLGRLRAVQTLVDELERQFGDSQALRDTESGLEGLRGQVFIAIEVLARKSDVHGRP